MTYAITLPSNTLGAGVPLDQPLTIYVDSVAGNDFNDGSVASPIKTLDKAMVIRHTYSVLKAVFTIQLVGVGPYLFPPIADSKADANLGRFIIDGDPNVIVALTGTLTADFDAATSTLPITGGSAALENQFVEMTSGAANGFQFQIIAATATTLVIATHQGVATYQPTGIKAGDGFRVWSPLSRLSWRSLTNGSGFHDCNTGSPADILRTTNTTSTPSHIVRRCIFQNSAGRGFQINNSDVGFFGVQMDLDLYAYNRSTVQCGLMGRDISDILNAAKAGFWYGAGLIAQRRLEVMDWSKLTGVVNFLSVFILHVECVAQWYGGNLASAGIIAIAGTLSPVTHLSAFRIQNKIQVARTGRVEIGYGKWVFACATPCLESYGYLGVQPDGTNCVVQGGSSANPAVQCLQKGVCWWIGAIGLSGSPAGTDVRVDELVQNIAYFNAANATLESSVHSQFTRYGGIITLENPNPEIPADMPYVAPLPEVILEGDSP
jgi:hypothetical protein